MFAESTPQFFIPGVEVWVHLQMQYSKLLKKNQIKPVQIQLSPFPITKNAAAPAKAKN